MTRSMGYVWHLRLRMAEKGMFQTSDLVPLLAERGVHLSREQVYRLVTSTPQRLSMEILAALCDILQVTPNDLIEVQEIKTQLRKKSSGSGDQPATSRPQPRRTTIRRPEGS